MRRTPLDLYDDMPEGQRSYLRHFGWHFNRLACEFACEHMSKRDESGEEREVTMMTKEEVDNILRKYNVRLKNNQMYDAVYVATMCKADYLHSSVPDEAHLALYVKDTIDDSDAGDGEVMRCWLAKSVARGVSIDWEDFLQ